MSEPLILAIDQGGQSSRVAIYSLHGEQLYCFSAACATTHIFVEGVEHIEQSPHDILAGIKVCLEKIKQALGKDINNIIAAGFSGQGSSLLCWDNITGEALSPVLSWQDVRAESILTASLLDHTQVQQLTGLRVSPHYGASKIRWCLDNNAQVIHANNAHSLSVGPIASYIFWHMSGTNVIDPGHAQRTLLWNLSANQWDKLLLDRFNIPLNILPECKYHNSYFGDVPLGDQKIPIIACARDQGASLFAHGLPEKNACYINIGTGAFIQRISDNLQVPTGLLISPLWFPKPRSTAALIRTNEMLETSSPTCYASEFDDYSIAQPSASSLIASLPQVFPASQFSPLSQKLQTSWYAWEATVNGAASAISFIEQQTGLLLTPAEINAALALPPIKNGYFLNAIGGLGAPWWRTDLQSSFSATFSPHEKILVWLESIVFQIVINVRLMNALGAVEKIYVSGGLCKADGVCQKLADLLTTPVYRSENADASLQGIACMTAGMPNEWAKNAEMVIFQPQANSQLVKVFELWHNAMNRWLSP